MRRFCPKCGSEKGEFIGGLCANCYWGKALEDFPPGFRVTVCRYCYRYLRGKRWIQRTDIRGEERLVEAAAAEVERQVELPEGVEICAITGTISARSAEGEASAVELNVGLKEASSGQKKEVKVLVGIDHQLCHDCYCASTGKYDAIVQVRAEGRRLDNLDKGTVERVVRGFSARSDERGRAEISEVKESEGGLDIKFTDLNPAKVFVRELSSITGADVVESARIVGVDKRTGGRAYRTTLAVKLPELRVGDMLRINDKIYRVSSFHRGRVVIEPLSQPGKMRSASSAQLEGANRVKVEDVRRVRMESLTDRFGTFLSIDEKRFLELPVEMVPPGMQPGDAGLLIAVGGKDYLVRARPPDGKKGTDGGPVGI